MSQLLHEVMGDTQVGMVMVARTLFSPFPSVLCGLEVVAVVCRGRWCLPSFFVAVKSCRRRRARLTVIVPH